MKAHEKQSMQFEPANIGSVIADLAKIDPAAPCLEQNGVCFTRAEVIRSAGLLALYFKEQGVGAGASIAIVAVNPLKGFQAAIALWSLGAAVLFLDPRQPIEELRASQKRAEVEAVFTDSKSFARRGQFELFQTGNALNETGTEMRFKSGSEDTPALILSSSGTTAVPRFRRVSHRAFMEGLRASETLLDSGGPYSAVTVGSLAYGAVLYHWIKLMVHGKFILSLPLVFNMKELHQALSRTDIQSVGLPPVIINDLLEFHRENFAKNGRPAYPHLKHLRSVGGPISPETLVRAYKELTPTVKNLYSMTGVGAVSVLSGNEILEKPNSVGKPLPSVSVCIKTEGNDECPAGQIGRIIANPEWKGDASPIDTGDLGWIDTQGYLFVHGRSEQVATRNSINVSLFDVERDVKKIEGVRDCIAFSAQADHTPDDFIFLALETDTDGAILKEKIRTSLAPYRRPDKIMIRTRLPRNPANKILLRDLKQKAIEKDPSFVDL